jgi:hypothetical protein
LGGPTTAASRKASGWAAPAPRISGTSETNPGEADCGEDEAAEADDGARWQAGRAFARAAAATTPGEYA